jgi:EAL domain-containing protein (putative c-di-GMP-specific phosphodiesterase class I)
MLAIAPPPLNVRRLVDDEHVVPHFQPLVSVKRRELVAVEGLSRGWRPESQTLVPAQQLFTAASAQGMSRELELLCRRKLLRGFRALLDRYPHLVLSLNMDPSSIDRRLWSGYLRTQVAEAGLSPRNIVLEIVEAAVTDEAELDRWVRSYREAGYLIAVDDVGAGHSNLNRISRIQPDVLKVDRYLVSGVDSDLYKQAVVRSLLHMSRNAGTMIVMEGVETEGEALALLEMGADVMQGFLFARPRTADELEDHLLPQRLAALGAQNRDRQVAQIDRKRFNLKALFGAVDEMRSALGRLRPDEFELAMHRVAKPFDGVECSYVLDDRGVQRTEMVLNVLRKASRQSDLFRPLPRGSDHTARDYFYMLVDGEPEKTTYVTTPHVSLVTGNACVTLSATVRDVDGHRYFLCMDVNAP